MDPANYYLTTLTTAVKNLAPIAVFLVGGYLLFIKGPFLLLRRSMREQKEKLAHGGTEVAPSEKSIGEKSWGTPQKGPSEKSTEKIAAPKTGSKPGPKPDPSREKRQESTREERRGPSRPEAQARAPEDVFELPSNAALSAAELKKRYFELLKQNHPDRVASMGPEFKKLAEKNTKEINRAYEALRKKAS